MEVTEVRKVRRRYRVTAGGEVFWVPGSLFQERPLEVGGEIDPEEYDQWLLLRQFRPALEYAVSLLAQREWATAELEARLQRAGYRKAVTEMVVYKLSKYDLLDDGEFARKWVAARSGRSMGKLRIAQELKRKGVDRETADQALEAIDAEEELAAAKALAEKALRRAKPGEDRRKTAQRITAMLARKGYGYETASRAVRESMRDDE